MGDLNSRLLQSKQQTYGVVWQFVQECHYRINCLPRQQSIMWFMGVRFRLPDRDLLAPTLDPEVCFLPLNPKLPTRLALVWKKHAVFSNAAKVFQKSFL